MKRTSTTGRLKLVLRRETLVLLAVTGIAAGVRGCDGDGSPDAAVAIDSNTPAPDASFVCADAAPPADAGALTRREAHR
jgi:hypothetical protein